MAEVRPVIESALAEHMPSAPPAIAKNFGKAVNDALFSGGKRIRPALTLLSADLVGGTSLKVLPSATAVEFIHISSLIFDDLPCMDNALKRRGNPSLHVSYGEGLAVLVALALLNRAYTLVIENADSISDRALLSHSELTQCIEAQIFGQALDISPSILLPKGESHEEIQSLRNLKASALVRLSVKLGAIFSGASEVQMQSLSRFAELLGDAYQISDDISDQSEDGLLAGESRHTTLPAEYGAENATLRVSELTTEAKQTIISEFGPSRPAIILCGVADYVSARCTEA